MKIISKHNIIPTICVSYTLVALFIISSEIRHEGMNTSHWNLLLGLLFTIIGVLVLSIHHIFSRFTPLVMILLQYLLSIVIVVILVYITGLFWELHPDAYKDAVRSFSTVYIVGAAIYYIQLRYEIRKQNKLLEAIHELESV